ncbi:MAG: hypothetical protein AB8I08_07445 [Sandaracinaceae bacterium]
MTAPTTRSARTTLLTSAVALMISVSGPALAGTASAQGELRLQEPGAAEGTAAPGLDIGSLRLGGAPVEHEDDAVAPVPIEVELDEALDEALEEEFGDELADEPGFGQAIGHEHEEGEHDAHAEHDGEHGAGAGDHGAEHGEGHHEEFDTIEFSATVLNFLIWLAIIIFLLRKPLTKHLAERRRGVEEGLVEAARLEKEAKAKHAEYSERLSHLDEELEKLRGEMIQAGEAEADRIIAEAEERASRMRKDAEFRIAQQMKQLRSDLTQEAIEAAVGAAERVLTGAVSAPDHERLANEYLDQLNTSMEDEVRA